MSHEERYIGHPSDPAEHVCEFCDAPATQVNTLVKCGEGAQEARAAREAGHEALGGCSVNERLHDLERLIEEMATAALRGGRRTSVGWSVTVDEYCGEIRTVLRDRVVDLERVLGDQ